MPILMLALMALAVFLAMGIMLFSATYIESRERSRAKAAGAEFPEESHVHTHAHGAHA